LNYFELAASETPLHKNWNSHQLQSARMRLKVVEAGAAKLMFTFATLCGIKSSGSRAVGPWNALEFCRPGLGVSLAQRRFVGLSLCNDISVPVKKVFVCNCGEMHGD